MSSVDSSFWEIAGNGFLPKSRSRSSFDTKFSEWMEERRFREEVVYWLRTDHPIDYLDSEDRFQLYSYAASCYVHAKGENTANRIPKEIAVPLVILAERLHRPPILAYATYCLNNWYIPENNPRATTGEFSVDDLCLKIPFVHKSAPGSRDEAWFILVHVEIEHRAAPGIQAVKKLTDLRERVLFENFLDIEAHMAHNPESQEIVNSLRKELFHQDPTEVFQETLSCVRQSLENINRVLNRMPEQCDPDIYFKHVRPYIFGFTNVVYEGCFGDQPQTFRGETGAQSSVIPTFQTFLGIRHKQSILTQHLDDMRNYMPLKHREFLESCVNCRRYVVRYPQILSDLYNACLDEFVKFRKKHLQYAIDYIHKKVDNPTGTGGTPYIQWLSELITETEEFYVK